MTTSLAIRFKAETLRSRAFGDIGAAYARIGTALDNPARLFMLQNFTDESLMFSFDGINDHIPLTSGGYLLIDVTANKTINEGFYLGEGEEVFVKQLGVPTSGAVYLTVIYGDTGY